MSNVLSNNTQAILLLTAPLITGRSEPTRELLTPSEYKRLARHLHQLSKEPADLLSSDADEILRQGQAVVDAARLKRLLGRGFALSQAIDRWQARGIWVVSRADSNYPQRLRDRLREDRPAVLYGCGERTILERGGLAVVGSRDVDEALVEYTESIGRLTAKARKTLVSGGARGIDQAAMRGALEAGGMVSGVLADGLEKSAMNRDHRRLLMDGQLVLVSPYDPGAGFNVGNAMQRNKLIYALADAALVVNSDVEKGGTWAGAVEQLGKLKFVPVFVRSTGSASTGLTALLNKGAFPWPNPDDADGLVEALAFAPSTTRASALPSQLTLAADDDPSTDAPPSPVVPPAPVRLSTTPMPESPEVEMAVAAPA
ncbi:MAG TPA: DNA protecting protein DprA, partial [Candidatus Accumulibacter sp.]|nr:DNA protecting protein DprA [Accumulibacter sp.]